MVAIETVTKRKGLQCPETLFVAAYSRPFNRRRENFAVENIEKRVKVGVAELVFQMFSLRQFIKRNKISIRLSL